MKTLDLGCGNRPEHIKGDGLDKFDFKIPQQKYVWDLERLEPFPIADNEYDVVRMFHLLEHIQKPEACINILNEVWRVLKHNGLFIGEAPHYTKSRNYARDFYHCRVVTEDTFDAYLEGSTIHFNDYGVKCLYRKVNYGVVVNSNGDVCWQLQALK